MKKSILFALGVSAVVVPILAAPADIIRSRIAGYREVGAAFKAVNDGLRGEPQIMLIQQSIRQLRNAARLQYGWFPAGTGPQTGVKTAARPEIWAKAPAFKAAQDNFTRQADVLFKVSGGGNANAIRAAARNLGMTCKACHDQFRVAN
jgi:cytochrome c556